MQIQVQIYGRFHPQSLLILYSIIVLHPNLYVAWSHVTTTHYWSLPVLTPGQAILSYRTVTKTVS